MKEASNLFEFIKQAENESIDAYDSPTQEYKIILRKNVDPKKLSIQAEFVELPARDSITIRLNYGGKNDPNPYIPTNKRVMIIKPSTDTINAIEGEIRFIVFTIQSSYRYHFRIQAFID